MEKQLIEIYAKKIVDAGYNVHNEFGPVLLESVYLYCFMEELRISGITVKQEVIIPLFYRGNPLNKDLRLDLLVEN